MTTGNTALLGLALPVSGELSGSWGATVNDSITSLVDSAIAGTTTLSTDADVTLTTTNLAANQARQAILLCSGVRTALRTITAPARSKLYTVINATTGGFGVKLVGVGPTTGVTIAAGDSVVVTWDGTDFVRVNGVATATHNATSKTTPVDADELPLSDSAATFGLKKLTWANLKATLATWVNGGTIPGSFTALAASSTVSGTGFSTYLAAPPAIGGTTPAAGTFTSLNGGQLAGLRNRIINGGMRVQQRAVATISASAVYGRADRWIAYAAAATGISGNIQTGATAGAASGQALFLSNAGFTSGYPTFIQRIESANVSDLNSKTITISGKFYQDTGSTQNISIGISKANTLDTFTAVTVIANNVANNIPSGTFLTPFSATFVLGATDATNGLQIQISTTNALTVTTKNFGLADLQLELGSVATPFEQRPYGMELALCQRYLPAVAGTQNAVSAYTQSANIFRAAIPYRVSARVPPTGIAVSAATDFSVAYSGGGATCSAVTFVSAGTESASVDFTVAAAALSLPGIAYQSGGATSKLLFTGCEL